MKIEKVTVEDAEELLEIYAPYVENTAITFEYDVPSKDEFEERIKNISAKYPYIKAVHEGKIVGYAYAASFKDRRAYDWSVETTIYVKNNCKRMGIGKVLYIVNSFVSLLPNVRNYKLNKIDFYGKTACRRAGNPRRSNEQN